MEEILTKDANGRYNLKLANGKELKDYYFISRKSEGFRAIKKDEKGTFRFLDAEGNISEDEWDSVSIYSCNDMTTGFAELDNYRSRKKYRDMLGNIEESMTQKGKDYHAYYHDKISVFDLCDDCFADDKCIKKIIEHENNLQSQAAQHIKDPAELATINELFEQIQEYVASKAYEANQIQKQ